MKKEKEKRELIDLKENSVTTVQYFISKFYQRSIGKLLGSICGGHKNINESTTTTI